MTHKKVMAEWFGKPDKKKGTITALGTNNVVPSGVPKSSTE